MLFMDYRRYHSGLWNSTTSKLKKGRHPNAGAGLWGTENEIPSFLYAMPISQNHFFLEETCLVSKYPLSFNVLKRRLDRRIKAMGLEIKYIYDEEWSYIPVGGPLPLRNQNITAFGAAANLIHPATGYSLTRSLKNAPHMAKVIRESLKKSFKVSEVSSYIWNYLWSEENRRVASFHIFGMELLAKLNVNCINLFFLTFFKLPKYYWEGFLSSKMISIDLVSFALLMFLLAPIEIKWKLILHLFSCKSYF